MKRVQTDDYPSKPRFYIDKEGNWFQDGIPVLHRRTYLENNRNLRRDAQGRYYVEEGKIKVYVEVEDTPFVVKMIRESPEGIHIILNDETEELLEPDALRLSEDNVPYVKVKGGEFEARFVRPAYYELVKYLKEEAGNFYIEHSGKKYTLKRGA
jgi:hypothetical protein